MKREIRFNAICLALVLPLICAGQAVSGDAVDQLLERHPGVRREERELARLRGIFYQPAAPQGGAATPDYIGLRYKIFLQGPQGQVREVSEKFPFASGQRFRLLLQPNIAGHLYIFHKGSNSKGARLFPDPRINAGDNYVGRFEEVLIPSSGWFKFDDQTGIEELYLFLSPRKLDDFDNLQYDQGAQLTDDGWRQVTAAGSDQLPPRGDAAKSTESSPSASSESPAAAPATAAENAQSVRQAQPDAAQPEKGIQFEAADDATLCYVPPVTNVDDWEVNAPANSFVLEPAPLLIHRIALEHRSR